ncbi:MAG: TonB-dependent receptor [Saprospiraceae bacterium]
MKKILSFCLFIFFLFSFSIPNKTVNITGKVVDQTSQTPLGYATITVLDAQTKSIVAGETTDESGTFKLKVPTGKYDVKIEFLSFKSHSLENVDIQKDLDLKIIELEPDATQLAGVEVVGERSTIEYKLDKKVFNVGKDVVSKGGNVTDILDNVPSVSVDARGGISLRGNENVRILINGKPSVLSANGGLEQLPADIVAQVEVITNPSARYEASGTAGIINIVLKKNKKGGLGASLQLTSGYPANHRTNMNMNYKTEKFNLFTNIGYRYSNFFGERTRQQSTLRNGQTRILNQTEDQIRNDEHYNIYIGGDYYLNKKNTVTISYFKDIIENTDEMDIEYSYANSLGEVDSMISQFENYSEPQNFNQLEIDYEKTFDKKGQKFTTSIVYDWWNDDENESLTLQNLIPFNEEKINTVTRDIESSKDFLLQADFVSPLKNNGRIEAGFRGEIRRITSDYSASINQEPIPAFSNLLNYDEQIYGAYLQYGKKIKQFNYLFGLRTELSDIGIGDREKKFSDDKNYIGFFPTAHLTYNFSEKTNLQLSYSRRINRPRFWQLNPFGGLSDIRNRFEGNPDLNPMYTDSYELGFLNRWGNFTLNPSIYFQHNTDYFQFVTRIDEEGNFLTFPVNLSHENRGGVEISAIYNPVNWLRLSSEFNYYQFKQVGEFDNINFDTENSNWSARLNSRMKFKKGLTMQGTFRYRAKRQSGQSLIKAQHSLDFGISKDLLGEKGNLSLNFRNILDSRIERETVTGENYLLKSEGKRMGRRFTATFTYRFNRKKNERDRMPGS